MYLPSTLDKRDQVISPDSLTVSHKNLAHALALCMQSFEQDVEIIGSEVLANKIYETKNWAKRNDYRIRTNASFID